MMDTFIHILDQQHEIGNMSMIIDDEKYNIPKLPILMCYALNILLVLEEGRLAYRSDVQDKNINRHLIKAVLDHNQDLMELPYIEEEPLIILKKNYELVKNMLCSDADFHIAIGKVLGYAYTGPDWSCGINDTYNIGYVVQYDGGNTNLYRFIVPMDKYNGDIKQQIIDDAVKYQNILDNYGFNVNIQCMLHLGGETPQIIDLP